MLGVKLADLVRGKLLWALVSNYMVKQGLGRGGGSLNSCLVQACMHAQAHRHLHRYSHTHTMLKLPRSPPALG